jgi:hypothetical protein
MRRQSSSIVFQETISVEWCLCHGDVHSMIVDQRVPGDCKKMIEIYYTAHVCDLRWCFRNHSLHFMNFVVHILKKMVESLNEGICSLPRVD